MPDIVTTTDPHNSRILWALTLNDQAQHVAFEDYVVFKKLSANIAYRG
jgi:hypothetical protein